MQNPYTSPTTEPAAPPKVNGSTTAQRICLSVSIVAILVFAVVSLLLVSQAVRLGNESQNPNLPPRLQNSAGLKSMAVASWVGGITAIAGVALNAFAIVLSRRGKVGLSTLIVVLSIVAMLVVALMFKPS